MKCCYWAPRPPLPTILPSPFCRYFPPTKVYVPSNNAHHKEEHPEIAVLTILDLKTLSNPSRWLYWWGIRFKCTMSKFVLNLGTSHIPVYILRHFCWIWANIGTELRNRIHDSESLCGRPPGGMSLLHERVKHHHKVKYFVKHEYIHPLMNRCNSYTNRAEQNTMATENETKTVTTYKLSPLTCCQVNSRQLF